MAGLTIGSALSVHASGEPEPISAKVTEMRDLGEFATWRAARASGDHDLNTFFLRLDPVVPASKLTAGETVFLELAAAAKK